MAKLTEGNALYLYRLLRDALGTGRQAPLARVEEALADDGIAPADVGCPDVAALAEKLSDFVKLTTFKKGRVYATVVASEDLDRAIEKSAVPDPAQAGARNGKPWKRKRGGKGVRPVKPRHVEPKPDPVPEAKAGDARVDPDPVAEPVTEPTGKAPPDTTVKTVAQVLEEVRAGQDGAVGEEAASERADAPASEAEAVSDAEAGPEPEDRPEAEPEARRGISLNITYDPYEGADAGLADVVAPDERTDRNHDVRVAAARAAATRTTSEPPAPAVVSDAPQPVSQALPVQLQSDLPQDFLSEVRCGDGPLNALYRVLPLDEDIMRLLDEDWRVARSTGSLSGTRSNVSFPLRYLREDGSGPVTVTLRRSAQAVAGKRWSLACVDGDDGSGQTHGATGLEGLPRADEGAWSDLSGATRHSATRPNPARELAQFAVIGSWDAFLGGLAAIAAPEPWDLPGKDGRLGVLREYVSVTFHRSMVEGRLATSADGSLAAFNTGLSTAFHQDVLCAFEGRPGDIAWQFAGFCTAESDGLGRRVASALEALPEPPEYLHGIDDVRVRRDATATVDADGILGRQLRRLPRPFVAAALGDDASPDSWGRLVRENPELRGRLAAGLEEACGEALRRCRGSYRVAVPAYDPSDERLRLMLPLSLVSDERADAALVLERRDDATYRGVSVLPLGRAYACARVISSEQPAWLDPRVVLAKR